jgi:hypothetical protein
MSIEKMVHDFLKNEDIQNEIKQNIVAIHHLSEDEKEQELREEILIYDLFVRAVGLKGDFGKVRDMIEKSL